MQRKWWASIPVAAVFLASAGLGSHAFAHHGDAQITIDPGAVSYSDGAVTISGSGWREGSMVDITFSSDDSTCLGYLQLPVSDEGTFSVSGQIASLIDAEPGSCRASVVTDGWTDDDPVQVDFRIVE